MRKPVIAGNWKMHKLIADAIEFVSALKPLVANANHCEIVIAPVFTQLKTLADRLEGTNIRLAGQNCAIETKHGARTGEIAADMLRDAGARFCIVGHSERRQFYGETDESVNQKTVAAVSADLTAIVCVGETLPQREAGRQNEIVEQQLSGGLSGLTTELMNRIIIAYEPVWAIGTGVTASPEQAGEMHEFIRRTVARQHSETIAATTRILYGGSVKPDNIRDLMRQPDIDGALVGGASLAANDFANIVNYKQL